MQLSYRTDYCTCCALLHLHSTTNKIKAINREKETEKKNNSERHNVTVKLLTLLIGRYGRFPISMQNFA